MMNPIFLLLPVLLAPVADSLGVDSAPGPKLVVNGPVRVEWQIVRMGRVLTIGDRIRMRVRVTRPRELTVSPPVPANPEELLILNQKHHTEYRGDSAVDGYELTVAVFATGERRFAPFLVNYQDKGEVWVSASDSIPLKVASLISDKMQDINELKPQITFPNLLPLWVAVAVLGCGFAGYLGWRLWQRYRRRQEEPGSKPSPWDEAFAALGALPVEEWLEAGQIKRLYYTVSEIVKRYLTRRFGFPAIDQTTSEIIRELKSRRVGSFEQFMRFFFDADLVKYARYVPPEPGSVVGWARELVELTRPVPEAVGENQEGK